MKRLSLFIPLIAALLCPLFIAARGDAPSRIVFIAGNRSHASGEHEFNAGCHLLARALNEQSGLKVEATVLRADWHRNPEDKATVAAADTVVIYADGTSGHGGQWEFLDGLAKKGVGIVFMHYAVHPNPDIGEKYYRPWIGAAMEDNYSVNPHWVADLDIIKDHEIGNGVPENITCLDEWYYHMRFVPERSKVLDLFTAVPTRENMHRYINMWNQNGVDGLGKRQTLMWGYERPDGKGRGVGFTGGHYHHTWAIDGVRTAVLNAIVWTAGMKVPDDGVQSKALTEDEFNANLDDYGAKTKRLTLPDPADWKKLPPAKVDEQREAGFKAGGKTTSTPKRKAPKEKKIATEPLYRSPLMKSGDKQRLIEVDIPLSSRNRNIYLVVSDEGDKSHDWADWIEPEVVMADGTVLDLTTVVFKEATTGHGQVRTGRNCSGGPLRIAGTTYRTGIGTHADSVIHLAPPKGGVRFRAKIGLDDGGADRGKGPTPASVRFYVFDKEPEGIKKAAEMFDPESTDPQMVPVEMFEAPEDLEVTVWATSPMLFNPTNMDTDAAGRIWVAEGVNYRRHQTRRPEGDRIIVLEDTDHDGKADSVHTFVQDPELVAPLGVSVLDNQVVVAQPPHLIVYTDVDRDLRFDPQVDRRENLLSGFNARNHDHSLHAVVAGPDGKWYFNNGNCGAMFTDKSGKTFKVGGPYKGGGGEWFVDHQEFGGAKSDDGHVWVGGFAARMDPDGSNVQVIGHGFRNSYEHTVTSAGDVFQNDNDDPPACRNTWLMEGGFLGFFSPDGKRTWKADQRPGQTVPEAHWRQWDPGTLPPGDVYGGGSPTGICYYEHGALPEKYANLLLSCEAARKVVFGYHPQPEGANFKLERFDFFRATTGNMFRPSDVMVGADGAIYVADWFDPGVGGHNDRDASCSGTIYRIAPRGFTPRIPKVADPDSIAGAIELLRSPAINVRYAGWKTLKQAGPKALPAVKELLGGENDFIAARAVWLLPFLGGEGRIMAEDMLGHGNAEVRLLAFRALRNAGEDPMAMAARLVDDPSPAVRRELAVALRDADAVRRLPVVVRLFSQYDGEDRTYLEACGLAADGIEAQVWDAIRRKPASQDPLQWSTSTARTAWRLKPAAAVPDLLARAASPRLSDEARLLAIDSLAFIDAEQSAHSLVDLTRTPGPVGAAATRWLIHLASTRWSQFGVKDLLKEEGIYDPEKVTVTEVVVPRFGGPSRLPATKEILALEGDPTRGKARAAACIMCHEIEGTGVNFGPSLRGWVKNQGAEMFVRALVKPSEQIAHGYSGSTVRLKDGGEVQGLLLSRTDPVIVQSQGGLVQVIPATRVDKVEAIRHSLMLSADQLGLDAQAVADIMAYLKTLN